MQKRLSLFLALSLLCSLVSAANLTDAQKEKLQQLVPGTTLSDSTMSQMADIFYTREMPVRDRLQAISKLVGLDQMPKGSVFSRTICIWDIAGRNGPVFNAAMEQRALATEYGIDLKMEPYTSETVMVEEFKAGRCDFFAPADYRRGSDLFEHAVRFSVWLGAGGALVITRRKLIK